MQVYRNYSLLKHNTFAIDASAEYFIECSSMDDIYSFLSSREFKGLPLVILGGGSNILFTKDFNGTVLSIKNEGIEVIPHDGDNIIVKVAAGERWDRLVEYCVNQGWGGLENLSLIPGNAGSSPIQNIGAYGVEIKDLLLELETVDMETGELKVFKNSECRFGYRDSIFKRELKGRIIIVSATFKLSKFPEANLSYDALKKEFIGITEKDLTIQMVRDAVIRIRRSKLPDPAVYGNAGSFFKNPTISEVKAIELKSAYPAIPIYTQKDGSYKAAAGWLIEQCGWKGKRIGNVGVYEKQALVLINYGGAKGYELLNLAESISNSVTNRFDIRLEMEVNVI